ncbi:MAG TPA: murein biosynthesis integral membrane protein MurJ [Sneathiellales bacterium]|nr:murein biosynthesis integral membrane protein MurJ [Sneathiellales bacterium]
MNLLRSVATVGGFTSISRALGFVRDILIAATLGAGWIADCFFVAFKIPNFFRRLFAEGAFNAAFVPSFSEILSTQGSAAARRFAEQALAVLLAVLAIFVGLLQIFMPWLMAGLAPGFVAHPEKYDLAVVLTRITIPYLLFISLISLMGGVLNSLGRFAAVAATPILLNLSLIAALIWLAGATETPAHALAWGVSIAGVLQFLWLAVECRRAGISLRLPRPRLSPKIKNLLRLMAPAALGAGVVQVNLLIDVVIASLLPTGSLSYLFYADRLNQLPIGVVGVAVGTALLPLLSRQVMANQDSAAVNSQNRAVEFGLLLTLPAAAALMTLSGPLVGGLFERGAFGPAETRATALALTAYAAGLPAYVLIKILGPGFFARKDTRTPVRFAIIAVVVNVVLNLVLMVPLKHVGLALATAISAWLNVTMLAITLHRRGHLKIDLRLRRRLPRTVAAAAFMAAGLWGGGLALEPFLSGGEGSRVVALAILVVGGLAGFAVLARLLGSIEGRDLQALLRGEPSATD